MSVTCSAATVYRLFGALLWEAGAHMGQIITALTFFLSGRSGHLPRMALRLLFLTLVLDSGVFMRASFDTVAQCNSMLREFGIPAATIAALTNLTRAKLCRYLNESERLGGVHDRQIREACENLKRLDSFRRAADTGLRKTRRPAALD